MSSDLDLLLRLKALEARRALLRVSHFRLSIQPDAMILCPLAMAGEDTTIHIVACGRLNQPPQFHCVADPRNRSAQYQLFEWLFGKIEPYFADCRSAGTWPQLWVSSSAGQGHLDTLAERLRYNQENSNVKRLGELLSYATDRYPVSGQMALLAATEALALHYATGQMESENDHLGAMLAWIEAMPGQDTLAAVAKAEQMPMGVKTDPVFDKEMLEPLVAAYHKARRQGASARQLLHHVQHIQDVLTPVAWEIYAATQRAIGHLIHLNLQLPELPDLHELEKREAEAFASFMAFLDNGGHLALRDKPKAAAIKLADREESLENVEAACVNGDRIALLRAKLSGHAVEGVVANPQKLHLGPRLFQFSFELATHQRVLHLREGDELYLLSDPRMIVVVTSIRKTGGVTRIGVNIMKGARSLGLPQPGQTLEFVTAIPDWHHRLRQRKQMRLRLKQTPWTHAPKQAVTP